MNRQQRRASNKKQQYNSKADGWMAIQTMIVKNSVAPQDEEAYCEFMTRIMATLDALTGTKTAAPWLDSSGFFYLNEMLAFCFELSRNIYESAANEGTKQAILPSSEVCNKTADALMSIGERFNEKGVYRATGDELSVIREMSSWLDSLLQVASQGITMRSLIAAKNMVDQKLKSLGMH